MKIPPPPYAHRKKYKIVFAEDKILVRKAISDFINSFKDFEIVQQCNNGLEVMDYLDKNPLPDILITDLQMPLQNGYETIKQVKACYPQIKILVLTVFDTDDARIIARNNGGDILLSKAIEPKDLIEALYNLCTQKVKEAEPQNEFLSEIEFSLLKLMCEGIKFKEIPEKLYISNSQAEKIRSNLFKKFSVDNSICLVKYVTEKGIII